jgi:nucleoside-diphosphate-sugar epimerase
MAEENKDGGTSSTRILVVGASGYLGRYIVARLRQAGYAVRALVRDPARFEPELARDGEIRVGQVTRAETLEGLCDGISIVVSALGLRSLARKPTPWEVDYQGNINVLTCAQRAGVKRFVFVGVLHGADWCGEIPYWSPESAS